MKYRPYIDGLRATAVVSVMLYHVNPHWLPGGFVGVDVFFVISGFVVSASLASSSRRGFAGFIAEFYARRLARIAPALVVMLTCASVASTLFIPQAWLSGFSEKTALYAFLGLSNWLMQNNADAYFAPRAEFSAYTHTWSLGVEEQFYLVWPILLFLWVRAQRQKERRVAVAAFAIVALGGIASLIGCVWATSAQPTSAFYSILFRFWELAAGALLFQSSSSWPTKLPTQLGILALCAPWAGLVIVGASMLFATQAHFPYPWAMVVVAGTVLLLGGVDASTAHPVRRLLAQPSAVWVGKRSYSLYLWHWPIFVLMRWTVGFEGASMRVLALLATFAIACASYRLVEIPFRRNALLERFQPAVRIVFFLVVVLGARKAVQRVFWHGSAISLSTVTRNAVDWYAVNYMPFPDKLERVCEVSFGVRELADGQVYTFRPTSCLSGRNQRTMTVLGDSHAGAYLPMLEELSAEDGVTINIYSFAGCPYLDLQSPMTEGKPRGCVAFVQAAAKEALTTGHPGDIVFLPSLRQPRVVDQWGTLETGNVDNPRAEQRRALATEEAVSWLRPFVTRGMTVLFEAPTPIFRSPPFRCSDRFNASNPICRGGLTQPRSYLEHLRGPILASMHQISGRLPTVRVWDSFTLLCPAETCAAVRNGRPLFFDGDHLSAYGNAIVYPSFKSAVATLGMSQLN